ncbi:MAG: YraN family protein [Hyphomicrobiaceae bacterium]
MTGAPHSRSERRRRFRLGLQAETVAAALLRAKGYRILARRFKTPVGELDIVAVRRRRLAFVEVKRRITIEVAADAVTPKAQRRLIRAAQFWLSRWPKYQTHDQCFDMVLLAPGRWPRHLQDVFGVPGDMWGG